MKLERIFLISPLLIVLVSGNGYAGLSKKVGYSDVRVLIDVSGSMKRNDPKNLRIPALKLLVNLLPPETNAGIWLFDQDAQSLVPVGKVDDDWKNKALRSSPKIHSRGLFTDIEKVLDQATKDWTQPQPDVKRSLILLTDGVVDVSKNIEESQQSRKRVVENLLPRLQQSSAQVHTIALSANADHELLRKLAFSTGGWNESVNTASELHRIFLKMFKKAVPRDNLPLVGNSFRVDNSIKEFSLLVFRQPDAKETRLISPDNSELSLGTTPENVKWLHEEGYDLITVQNPKPGKWQFVAETDPDNEVLILTDLKLNVSELPNYVYVNENEPLEIVASLTEQDTTITREDFLSLVKVTLKQTDDLSHQWDWIVAQKPEEKGIFGQKIDNPLAPGKHAFTVIVDGKTFQRQADQTVMVVDNPVAVELIKDNSTQPPRLAIKITPDQTVIDTVTMEIHATLSRSEGESQSLTFSRSNDVWEHVIPIPRADERWVVNLEASAKTFLGNPITPQLQPLIIDGKEFAKILPQPVSEGDKKPVDELSKDQLENPLLEQESVEKPDWIITTMVAVGINLVLAVAGFFAFRYVRNRGIEKRAQLIDRLAL